METGRALPCSGMAASPSGSSTQSTARRADGGERGVDDGHRRRGDLRPDPVAEQDAESVGAVAVMLSSTHSDAGAVEAGSSRTHQVRTLTNSRMPAAASSRP